MATLLEDFDVWLKVVGQRVYKLRTGREMSQDELAAKVNLSQYTISRAEWGNFSLWTLKLIADSFGVELAHLLREATQDELQELQDTSFESAEG